MAYGDASFAVKASVGHIRDLPASKEEVPEAQKATHGRLAGAPDPDISEVQLRIGVRGRQRTPVERFSREIAPLILNGPPGVTGFAGGRPKVEDIVAYWPALISKSEVYPKVEIFEA